MYKEILRNIENVEVWPIISFVIFFLFFLILLVWVFTADKKFISHMKELPLDDEPGGKGHTKKNENQLLTKTSISQ